MVGVLGAALKFIVAAFGELVPQVFPATTFNVAAFELNDTVTEVVP